MEIKATQKPKRIICEISHKKPSLTVPNEAYTISQLLDMHRQGLRPLDEKIPHWENEIFGEEMNPLRKQNFDLSDLDDLRDANVEMKAKVKELRNNAKRMAKNKEKQQIIEEYERTKDINKETAGENRSNNPTNSGEST